MTEPVLSHSSDPHAPLRVALLRRGEPAGAALDLGPRFAGLLRAFESLGVEAESVAYADDGVDTVRARLLGFDAVLVWIDPVDDDRDRSRLDPMLRDLAGHGVWVSTHPDVILKMGVKAVLWRTRTLGWSADTHLYETAAALRSAFPARLLSHGPRVLKQNRGNGGLGVWKVEAQDRFDDGEIRVEVIAAKEDRARSGLRLSEFLDDCARLVALDRPLVDQAFQARVADGMVRCYLSRDRVVGFAEQAPRSAGLAGDDIVTFAMASAKQMHDETAPAFQGLRRAMETDWVPGLQRLLEVPTDRMPALWDADFLYGPRTAAGENTFVLCEINVSSVSPFPPSSEAVVARVARDAAEVARSRWTHRWRR